MKVSFQSSYSPKEMSNRAASVLAFSDYGYSYDQFGQNQVPKKKKHIGLKLFLTAAVLGGAFLLSPKILESLNKHAFKDLGSLKDLPELPKDAKLGDKLLHGFAKFMDKTATKASEFIASVGTLFKKAPKDV